MRATSEQHDRITRELNEERAAALIRISRTLESLIAQLHDLRRSLLTPIAVDAATDSHRQHELDTYRHVRAQALRYRWYLEVQREAIGLRHHHRLDEFYAVPPDIKQ
ncbi:MAG TPA: hypothetical protein VL173_10260 [Vicinamibacterales bacterium]|nr:hypothetical protein [Vicinamibacterales bacterium]